MAFKTTQQQQTNKPAQQFRAGAISVSIWKKDSQEHGPFYTAQPQRSYKNDADEWAYSDSFGRDEIPVISKLMDMAFGWILKQERADKEAAK